MSHFYIVLTQTAPHITNFVNVDLAIPWYLLMLVNKGINKLETGNCTAIFTTNRKL